jgi:hypothetical protein
MTAPLTVQYLCVHGHFYQPARGNPFSKEALSEPEAAPYPNWNARITAECYEPNASIGNFDKISFNMGETLAAWLAANARETYERIIKADLDNVREYEAGNAIAQPMHHTILPLSRREDKVTQVAWGRAVFTYRFGRQSRGMWLPEMAVDFETLEVLVEQGIEWTILTERQVTGKRTGAGPYWVRLPNGKRIKVFVRDEGLSNDIAFNLGHFGGAGRWAREVLVPRRRDAGALTLIATDGETYGHHWKGEEQFLHWLLTYEALAAGYEVTTLGRYVQEVKPVYEVELEENTSWSCGHGLARWSTGCSCTPGDSFWKGALRRAMDNLRGELDGIYTQEVGKLDGVDPFALRDAYIKVVLGYVPPAEFLKEQEVEVDGEGAERLLKLVEAQYYRQRMYASCAFFFSELDALTPRYGIANAAYAIKKTFDATGIDLAPDFRRDLSVVVGQSRNSEQPITGADLFDEIHPTLGGM